MDQGKGLTCCFNQHWLVHEGWEGAGLLGRGGVWEKGEEEEHRGGEGGRGRKVKDR